MKNKRILFIEHILPTFDQDAGSYISFQYLKILKELGADVTFWPNDLKKRQPYHDKLLKLGIKPITFDNIHPNQSLNVFKQFICSASNDFDYIILSKPDIAIKYLPIVQIASNAKIIYLAHDLHYLRMNRAKETTKDIQYNNTISKQQELDIMNKSAITLLFSDDEKKILHNENNFLKTETIPWIQAINTNSPKIRNNKNILFLGGFWHAPNVDAVIWFHDTILPLLQQADPDIKISIIGSNPVPKINKLHKEKFIIHGFVENLKPHFDKSKIFISPLRFGAGFKGKIAMAMSFGIPVVTTPIGAEGIGLQHNHSACIADNSTNFANHILELLNNDRLCKKMASNSLNLLKNNFSFDIAKIKFNNIINNL